MEIKSGYICLQPIVKKYNNTIHRTIGTTPNLASKDPSLVKVVSPSFGQTVSRMNSYIASKQDTSI